MLCEESYSFSSESNDSSTSSDAIIIEQQQPSYDDVALIRVLNKAKFPVFLGYSSSMNENLAVKVFPFCGNAMNPCYLNEVLFANLKHKNVLNIVHYESDREAIFDDGAKKISYTIMELAPYGDFFDFVMSQKVHIDTKLARTYFKQLIEGLEYLHQVGVAHLDLKLDNLLLGENYNLKIGDFDQAFRKGQKTILSKGTVCYRAPELVKRTCKDPEAADIYSAGIILFLLKSGGVLPHSEQQKYKCYDLFDLMVNNPALFWEKHCEIQRKDSAFFDEDFKNLFNAMIQLKPENRPTISQIKASKWYNGPVYTENEVRVLMKNYHI
jgi:serine/threonine protein kinase